MLQLYTEPITGIYHMYPKGFKTYIINIMNDIARGIGEKSQLI